MIKSRNKSEISRRKFIKQSATAVSTTTILTRQQLLFSKGKENQPNIIFINTDQHSAEALAHLGNKHLKTPHMDGLAKRGISFTKSYSANPVCCPARAAWFTGRPSVENGVISNGNKLLKTLPDLGQWLKKSGYNVYYAGKWHIPGRNVDESFNYISDNPKNTAETGDIVTTRATLGFLKNYKEKKPFFISVGLVNPHDICSFVLTHTMHEGKMPFPEITDLPPLPPNFNTDMKEPEAIVKSKEKYTKEKGPETGMHKWEEKLFQYYIWSYYRYIEKVDGQIGLILDAVKSSRFKENTMIILTSDHGDGHIRHKMVFKSFLYDEAARVPFIISWPGHIKQNVIDKKHLVSGVDLFPTVCDFGGITKLPPNMRGYSLRPLAEGKNPSWRKFVTAYTSNGGTMLRTDQYKLIKYKDDPVIQLFDMDNDPWETKNLAENPSRKSLLKEHEKTSQDYEKTMIIATREKAGKTSGSQLSSKNKEWIKK